jgi:hypothetical protein
MKRPKLGYANAAATLAVIVAVGGTAPFAGGTTTEVTAATELGVVRVYRKKVDMPSPTPVNYSGQFTVLCPSGQQAIAGGGNGSLTLTDSYPAKSSLGTPPGLNPDTFRGWAVRGIAPPLLIGASETVYVVCVE